MRYPNKTWTERATDAAKSIEQCEDIILNKSADNLSGIHSALYHAYKTIAIDQLINKEIAKFRMSCYDAASTAMYTYREFNSSWYVAQIYPFGLALLSDNDELIDTFLNEDFKSNNKWIKTSYLLQVQRDLINDNKETVLETLKFIDHKISIKKNLNLHKANKLCISGIIEKEPEKILEGINLFEKPTQKNSLIRNEQCETVFSVFPTIYLKIAEMKGMAVEFENSRIIKDAVIVSPLPEYKIRMKHITK